MHRCVVKEKPVRVSHRAIALESGVSQATVSRALRNDARISEEVRKKVSEIAAKMGYRPDPHVSKLMTHMRSMQETHFQSVLGFILPLESYNNEFMREMLRGARERADVLGYVVNDFRTGLSRTEMPGLNRVLRARGVEGIAFFPRHSFEPAPQGLDLSDLAAVSCASFEGSFPIHRVKSGHAENMALILGEVARRKCRRPGLVTWDEFDHRQRWAPRMGYYYFYHDILGEAPLPIFDWHRAGTQVAPAFLRWYREVQPDVLLVVGPTVADSISRILASARIRKKAPMLGIGHMPAGYRGINEKPANLGAAAIDILTSHIVRNEKGWPRDVKVMTLPGELR